MFVLVFNVLGLQSLFGLGFRGFCCCFGDKVCVCRSGWPGTHYLDQGGFKLSNTHLLCLPSTEVKGVCHTPHSFSSFIKLKWHKVRLTAIQCLPCISCLLFNRATKVSGCLPRLHRSLIAALGGERTAVRMYRAELWLLGVDSLPVLWDPELNPQFKGNWGWGAERKGKYGKERKENIYWKVHWEYKFI